MKKFTKTTLLGVLILLAACANPLAEKQAVYNQKKTAVIAVHDEVMPKMKDINSLIKQLEPKVDTTTVGKQHQKAIEDLQYSYDYMMRWMKEFGQKFDLTADVKKWDANTLEANIEKMTAEEAIVEDMKQSILGSIAEAEKLLK